MSVYSFEELLTHVGHDLEVVAYGEPAVSVAIECLSCGEVLVDYEVGDEPIGILEILEGKKDDTFSIEVVNMKTAKYDSTNPNHVYIGRGQMFRDEPIVGSVLANQFKISNYLSREKVIMLFEETLKEKIRQDNECEQMQELVRIARLESPVLFCWCKPEGCHGDVIAKYVLEVRRLLKQQGVL